MAEGRIDLEVLADAHQYVDEMDKARKATQGLTQTWDQTTKAGDKMASSVVSSANESTAAIKEMEQGATKAGNQSAAAFDKITAASNRTASAQKVVTGAISKTGTATDGTAEGVAAVTSEMNEAEGTARTLAPVLGLIDTRLGAAATAAMDAGEAATFLSTSLKVSKGMLGVIGAALVVAGGTYAFFTSKINKSKEAIEDQQEAIQDTLPLFEKMRLAAIAAAVANGDMLAEDAAKMAAATDARELFGTAIRGATNELNESTQAIAKHIEATRLIEEEEITGSQRAMNIQEEARNKILAEREIQLRNLSIAAGLNLEKVRGLQQAQQDYQSDLIAANKALEANTEGTDDNTEATKTNLEDQTAALDELMVNLQRVYDVRVALNRALDTDRDTEIEAIKDAHSQRLEMIDEIFQADKDAAEAKEAQLQSQMQMTEELEDLEKQRANQARADALQQKQDQLDTFETIAGGFTSMANSRRQIEENRINQEEQNAQAEIARLVEIGEISEAEAEDQLARVQEEAEAERAANLETAKKIHRVEAALALSQIAIQTALNVVEAFPNPITMIAAGVVGAAQAGAVLAQPAPAHMGMIEEGIAPDEVIGSGRKMLTGEAILDRASVQRMGGPEGVRALMNGQQPEQVIAVVTPWKHLDKELGRSARANSRLSRSMRRAATITTGHGGW
jgi:hypothetical protein